jgi:ribose 1,5-bisphosphokinase PhnN
VAGAAALIISGPVGSGKTTVMDEASTLLRAADVAHIGLDFDSLCLIHPHDEGDRFATRYGFENLGAVWANARKRGIDKVLISRVVEHRDQISDFSSALGGAAVLVCRLRVPVAVMQDRLRARERGESLAWHVARAAELDEILDRSKSEDFVVENHDRDVTEVAREVLEKAGWL